MKIPWIWAAGAVFTVQLCAEARPPSDGCTIGGSPIARNATLTYRRVPPGICATRSLHQKQYTGYVSLPPFTLHPVQQNYTINTFFWFVEAREKPEAAPLTIYLSGGPGLSSMQGLFQETGPCEVVQLSNNEIGTIPREWGWDRSSHMLYIDQPVQVGFSYDTLKEASLDFLTGNFISPPIDPPASRSQTFRKGIFSSNDAEMTANTTETAAKAIWHMLQVFFAEFPVYRARQGVAEVNLFAESYGGKYGPAFAAHFHKQNEKRERGEISRCKSVDIKVKTLGILQGYVDDLVQNPYFSLFAYNNTYGLRVMSLDDVKASHKKFHQPGGCKDKVKACRESVRLHDPENAGDVSIVNTACVQATIACNGELSSVYPKVGRSQYDIAQGVLNPVSPLTYLEYLNMPEVQSAIGSRVNFTESSSTVFDAFLNAGDYSRGEYTSTLASLLDSGVRVALMYGDRDYICNWFGGQAVSFAIAAASRSSSPSYIANFNSAGYAPLIVNTSYTGGVVRQFANLSFARIYDAGHIIPYYQPEAVFKLFTRIIEGKNPSTGESIPNISAFQTKGDANSTKTNSLPAQARPTCYLRKAQDTCSPDQIEKMKAGKGYVINGIWHENKRERAIQR
ncbi:Serine carboxypeptidase family protein [Coccidioides posadasii C735 delta SOWgp]|uniref:Carboxypeptidase n=1 Tax=Coccidioides posadasii (strain C735) TaxID=222929 RepID=C5P0D3_COCP7|nr:Serine carboxypeptidase family protein [Coccidioides posadasii C735 delta SOWgp]EER29141.1 Serine carboxypeptidase family protein [Coccidioides posadasii C735 delta SOWgp]|eukprot:XP_003071286.1 Serine carboxypeptidase family protein [Coccidioides posadasii C735 delta SOWgp]